MATMALQSISQAFHGCCRLKSASPPDVARSCRQHGRLQLAADCRSAFFGGGSHALASTVAPRRTPPATPSLPPVQAATGFGQKVVKAKPHKIRTLDLKKAGPTERYKVFFRKTSQTEAAKQWAPFGELWVEVGNEAAEALRERREKLQEAITQLYPTLVVRSGEALEYGIYKLVLPTRGGEGEAASAEETKQVEVKLEEVVPVDVEGGEGTASIPALLRFEPPTRKGPMIPGYW